MKTKTGLFAYGLKLYFEAIQTEEYGLALTAIYANPSYVIRSETSERPMDV